MLGPVSVFGGGDATLFLMQQRSGAVLLAGVGAGVDVGGGGGWRWCVDVRALWDWEWRHGEGNGEVQSQLKVDVRKGGRFGRVDVRMRSVDARITRRLGSLRADGMRMGEVGSSH